MSGAEWLEKADVYGASVVRARRGVEVFERRSEGGGLERSFDQVGEVEAITLLRFHQLDELSLEDDGLQIVFSAGEHEQMVVSRDGVEVFRQSLSVGRSPAPSKEQTTGPEQLGSADFCAAHGVKWAYVAGAMAGGISSVDLLVAMGRAGLMSFFGAGGLPLQLVEAALVRSQEELEGCPYGFNLLHNPNEPGVEEATVDLYLKYGVRAISASAFMQLSAAVVRYRFTGATEKHGRVHCKNAVFAKVSRTEVAEAFLRPAPKKMLDQLVAIGGLTIEEARLAAVTPVASDLTVEGDSGGHTDGRPLMVILPEMQALRRRLSDELGPEVAAVRVGAAGGLGTPSAVWGAFAMGADYVLTGSVNQATPEAGTSDRVKEMLSVASYSDISMGPAPDMFELGAHVQVLSRGSMYAQRAQKLYQLYRECDGLHAIPEKDRSKLERIFFKASIDEVWKNTREYWATREPAQVERAEKNPKHMMALTFRWYLGMSSRWARMGDPDRVRDYQIWCGPSMGGCNSWLKGGPLERWQDRSVVTLAEALMTGAARCSLGA